MKKISDEITKIMMLGDKSIKPEEIHKNLSSKNLFSHIIGQIDDNNGISGLENL